MAAAPMECKSFDIPDGDPRYNSALPWVGLYIAVASLFCAVFMVYDVYYSIRRRRLWIAPGIFVLNATTLTILSVAAKLPSDITTAMPGVFDQLARLSGSVLLCVVTNHIMPSLGLKSKGEIISDVIALGILVGTTAINIWIQVAVGIASSLSSYNIYFSVSMILMYTVFISYSLGVTPSKKLLKRRYNTRHDRILAEAKGLMNVFTPEVLTVYIHRYWLLALTSSPDYILRYTGMSAFNSALCHAAVGINFISALIHLMEVKGHSHGHHLCVVNSAYRYWTLVVLFLQTVTIVAGTAGSLLRSLNSKTTRSFSDWKFLFTVEKQWIEVILEWKEAPLPFLETRGRKMKKLIVFNQKLLFSILLYLQIITIFCGKLFLLIHIRLWRFVTIPKLMFARWQPVRPCESSIHEDRYLSDYVLHLEETEEYTSSAVKVVSAWRDYPQRWMENGRSHRPAYLLKFLSRYQTLISREYLEPCVVNFFDMKYWSISLATLVVIFRAVVSAATISTTLSMGAVREGFKYARFIERNIEPEFKGKHLMAAEMVWQDVDLYDRWLNVDLLASRNTPWAFIESLRDAAARELQVNDCRGKNVMESPAKTTAADCMVQFTEWILSSGIRSGHGERVDHMVMAQLEEYAALILADCMRSLPPMLFRRCWNGKFGQMEEGVREAALILGETEEIISFLLELDK